MKTKPQSNQNSRNHFKAPMKKAPKKAPRKDLVKSNSSKSKSTNEEEHDVLEVIDHRREFCCGRHLYNRQYRVIWAPVKNFFNLSNQAQKQLLESQTCIVEWISFEDIARSMHLLTDYEQKRNKHQTTPIKQIPKTPQCSDSPVKEIADLTGENCTINDSGHFRIYTLGQRSRRSLSGSSSPIGSSSTNEEINLDNQQEFVEENNLDNQQEFVEENNLDNQQERVEENNLENQQERVEEINLENQQENQMMNDDESNLLIDDSNIGNETEVYSKSVVQPEETNANDSIEQGDGYNPNNPKLGLKKARHKKILEFIRASRDSNPEKFMNMLKYCRHNINEEHEDASSSSYSNWTEVLLEHEKMVPEMPKFFDANKYNFQKNIDEQQAKLYRKECAKNHDRFLKTAYKFLNQN